jgi:glucokinase
VPHSTKIIAGPGTGLGCAIITYNRQENDYNVHPGEGGHIEYPSTTELEFKLRNYAIKWIKEKDGEELKRVSTERLTAGPALPLIYDFMREEFPDLDAILTEDEKANRVTPESVIEAALEKKDSLCIKVVEQFLKNLAVMLSDIAIISLCYGGIYICGGVATALKDLLLEEEDMFINLLSNKGRMSHRIKEIPVYLVIAEIGLDGAEQFGYQAIINDYEEL